MLTRLFTALLLLAVPVLGVYTFVTAADHGWWMQPEVSTFGQDVDFLFYLILGMVTFFFVLTEMLLFWFVWRYSKKDSSKAVYTHGSHKLEMLWTAVPAGLLVLIAFFQMSTWAEMRFKGSFPEGEPFAHVWASQFDWRFQYPGADGEFGTMDDLESPYEFVVPVNQPVKFVLHSRDVIHSFSVPAFRLKQDAMPGLAIPVWFQAEEIGEYDLVCMELCGWGHYKMAGKVRVVSEEDYRAYMAGLQSEFMNTGMEG
ncbi:MAG: cytochrome c oxidase subunit II [Planctomycetes bacterium]|nr:cytochrome c oxidase subunit II [Planctomycetota bacterium]